MLILAILLLFIGLFIFYLLRVVQFSKQDKKYALLCALGLMYGLPYGFHPPFYKWGWKKQSKDRVWGERIVRCAFEKANIGLSEGDREFFQQTCEQYAAGKTIDHNALVNRVNAVVARSMPVNTMADEHIHPLLNDALNTSNSRAQALLASKGIQASGATAPILLAGIHFAQMLPRVGAAIMEPNSGGFEIHSKSGERMATLQDSAGWEQWLNACRESVDRYARNRGGLGRYQVMKQLRAHLINGILQKHLDDLQESRRFLSQMEDRMKSGELALLPADVQEAERIFSYWHLQDSTRFNMRDHKNVRSTLMRTDFAPRFVETIVQAISPFYESLASLANQFPRQVIFYGSKHQATAHAAEQYTQYIFHLSKLVSTGLGQPLKPSFLLRVSQSEIEKARCGELGSGQAGDNLSELGEREALEEQGHIPLLLNNLKNIVLFDKGLDMHSARQFGWIIEMQTEDFPPEEHAQMDRCEYIFYKKIKCDALANCDFASDTEAAKKSQLQFMNQIVDKLLQSAPHPVPAAQEEPSR